MDSALLKQVEELFDALADVAAADRGPILSERCADNDRLRSLAEQLLASHDAGLGAFMDQPIMTPPPDDEPAEAPDIPRQIGQYEVVRIIGEGGMGTVYEARQQNPRRTVALKVVKAGLGSRELRRRFEHEAHLLGRLQHPGIAHIYEAGHAEVATPEGRTLLQHFFAMEYLEGSSLTEYVRAGNLDTRQRLEVFARICDAVEHAHERGVIHRDLKPANVIVTADGQPKVLDFGVARATNTDLQTMTLQTQAGQLIGTLAYMSPEQVTADPTQVDTRSDVYSLGVILFELLGEALPYAIHDRPIAEAVRIISDQEPTLLSARNSVFRGDLDTVVATALEKDRQRRYPSAAALAADIRRFLADEPIVARPPSALYKLGKFTKRHKGLVAGLVAAFLALTGGLVATSLAMIETSRQRDDAEQSAHLAGAEAAKSNAIIDLLEELLAFEDAERTRTPDYPYGRMLDDFSDGLADRLDGQPEVEFAIHRTVGSAYRSIGEFEKSLQSLIKAKDIATELYGPDDEVTADLLRQLAVTRHGMGRFDEAEADCREALAALRRRSVAPSITAASALQTLSVILRKSGRYAEAEETGRECVRLMQKLDDADQRYVAIAKSTLAATLMEVGRLQEAESLLNDVLTIWQAAFSDDHPSVAMVMKSLAVARSNRGDHAGAEDLARKSAAVMREKLGPHSRELADALNVLAVALRAQGDLAGAEPHYREALAINRKLHGDDHPAVAGTLHNLALLLHHQGKYDQAEPLYREVLAQRRKFLGQEHPAVARTLNSLGGLHFVRREYQSAEALFRKALEMRLHLLGEDHPDVATSYGNLGGVMIRLDQPAKAAALYRKAMVVLERAFSRDHPSYKKNLCGLGLALLNQDEYAQAEPLLRECVAFRQENRAGHWLSHNASSALGAALTGQRRYDEAEPILLAAYEAMSRLEDAPLRHRLDAAHRLVSFFEACNRPEQAARWRREYSALEADHADDGEAADVADSNPP
ncbi:MAG: serine/threonine protein kinase [bacterium]|nr:serine/threonine protein kinase [bacterium]